MQSGAAKGDEGQVCAGLIDRKAIRVMLSGRGGCTLEREGKQANAEPDGVDMAELGEIMCMPQLHTYPHCRGNIRRWVWSQRGLMWREGRQADDSVPGSIGYRRGMRG